MRTKLTFVAFALAAAATSFADISGSAFVQSGGGFAFDSGTYATSGDILFTGADHWSGRAGPPASHFSIPILIR